MGTHYFLKGILLGILIFAISSVYADEEHARVFVKDKYNKGVEGAKVVVIYRDGKKEKFKTNFEGECVFIPKSRVSRIEVTKGKCEETIDKERVDTLGLTKDTCVWFFPLRCYPSD